MEPSGLAQLTESLRGWPELGVHAVLIGRGGMLIYEEYFDGFDERGGELLGRVSMTRGTKHDLRPVTKSVVSALAGIALSTDAIRSLDFTTGMRLATRILRQHDSGGHERSGGWVSVRGGMRKDARTVAPPASRSASPAFLRSRSPDNVAP